MKENILKGCAMHLSFTPRGFANDEKTTLSDQSFMSTRGLCLRISKASVSCLAGPISLLYITRYYDLIEELLDWKIILEHEVNLVIRKGSRTTSRFSRT